MGSFSRELESGRESGREVATPSNCGCQSEHSMLNMGVKPLSHVQCNVDKKIVFHVLQQCLHWWIVVF